MSLVARELTVFGAQVAYLQLRVAHQCRAQRCGNIGHAILEALLIAAAQAHWRAFNAPHLFALVRAGAVFHKGKLIERPVDITPPEPGETTETEVA